ncbi:MAG TPA: UDP-N-acetylmuramate dehydrogenase [Nitrospiria bacterium]
MQKKNDLELLTHGMKGEIRFQEPLSRHTSLGIGGPADVMVIPHDEEDLQLLGPRIQEEGVPVMVLGAGSNLLVKDGGIRGVVIKLSRFRKLKVYPGGVWAEAGVPLPTLLKQGVNEGAEGFEFLYGIPGTVGGAVTMNAGTREGETGPLVRRVRLLTFRGEILEFTGEELEFDYRSCRLPSGIILSTLFRFQRGDKNKIQQRLQTYRERRNATQPLNLPNVGSIFKNPPGNFAGRLIEDLGLKGYRIGGAQISEKHGNFFVNRGGATARDVIGLIKFAGRKIQQERGIVLELEVRLVGRDGP